MAIFIVIYSLLKINLYKMVEFAVFTVFFEKVN